MNAEKALDLCLQLPVDTVLDIGCGEGKHAKAFKKAGKSVTTVGLPSGYTDFVPDISADYLEAEVEPHDLVWASHILEHQRNPGLFLEKCFRDCKRWFCVTVPPLKHEIVGGHVSLWNAGLLLYHMILAGWDCAEAKVLTYGYNITVLVEKKPVRLPPLKMDFGDIEALAAFFPLPVQNGFDGRIGDE